MIFFLRVLLPGALMIAGIVLLVIGGDWYGSLGVMLSSVALVIWLFVGGMWLSHRSTGDREAEEAARNEFARTGRWPYDPETDD